MPKLLSVLPVGVEMGELADGLKANLGDTWGCVLAVLYAIPSACMPHMAGELGEVATCPVPLLYPMGGRTARVVGTYTGLVLDWR